MNADVRAYFGELLGTFMLVFIGTSVAVLQGGPLGGYGAAGLIMVSFAFGGTLMVLVNVIGPVSGCHLNPAVTIPMVLAGKLPGGKAPGYIVAQLLGGFAASGALMVLLNGIPGYTVEKFGLGANGNQVHMGTTQLLGWEIVLTALFLFTIFSATRADFKGSTPLAIGGFLFIAHLVGAQLGDSSLNPARSMGPALLSGKGTDVLWIFCVGPVVGGLLGYGLYKVAYAD